MAKLVNRAKMSTSTTGTGVLTLGVAAEGYQSFAAAGVLDGDVVRYVIEDGENWEIGTGTYSSSGTSLSRVVTESSNAGSPINLSGSAVVFVGATAEDFFGSDPSAPAEWVRNPSWPPCEANAGQNRIVGLHAVWPDATFFAATVSGPYTINYGDGTNTSYSGGVTAYHQFNFNSSSLDGTDAPVTFTASTNVVNRVAHGYTNGASVRFYNIVSTTGVETDQLYYVIGATADTFQISLEPGGTPVVLTNDGSATLLPYKIAVVTIVPQAGQSLTSVNLFVKHNQLSLVNGYSTGWLDIAVALPDCTTLTIGSPDITLRHSHLERVRLNQLGAITSFSNLFASGRVLQRVEISDTITTVTSTAGMFTSCFCLSSAPMFNTSSVTTMENMFNGNTVLVDIPLYDTSSVTNMAGMFSNCNSLSRVPLFDTSSVTTMASMFSSCDMLPTIPHFNTPSLLTTNAMFSNATGLKTIPLINTSSVTTMISMFTACFSLRSVPQLDTSSVTAMGSMFFNCFSLQYLPRFNTSNVLTMNNMLTNCYSLRTVPLLDTSSATDMRSLFSGATALSLIPPLVTTSVTSSGNFNSMFLNCNNMSRMLAKDFRFSFSVSNAKLSGAALNEIYTNLPTVTGQTITVSGNYGISGDDPTIATAKGWTVTGS